MHDQISNTNPRQRISLGNTSLKRRGNLFDIFTNKIKRHFHLRVYGMYMARVPIYVGMRITIADLPQSVFSC
jgi:hypothetical protein